jgi:hypothetical protein
MTRLFRIKDDGVEIELGSIGVQHEGWVWGIDNIVPMIGEETDGVGKDRRLILPPIYPSWSYAKAQARG